MHDSEEHLDFVFFFPPGFLDLDLYYIPTVISKGILWKCGGYQQLIDPHNQDYLSELSSPNSWVLLQKLKVEKSEEEKRREVAVAMETEKEVDSSAPPKDGVVVDSC